MPSKDSFLQKLQCAECGNELDPHRVWNLCPSCNKPLIAFYDLKKVHKAVKKEDFATREATMWRYHELLPVEDVKNVLTLGEGFTPLLHARRLAEYFAFNDLFIKEEGQNPTGSFKSRGLAAAVSRAKELGIKEVSIPSVGNAGVAMAAYAALGGLKAHVFMPRDAPRPFVLECIAYGAEVRLVDGLITDCARVAADEIKKFGWFDMATLREPYRVEGKKTLGFEVAEQMGWQLPDVIVYPTGGGTGLIGMWKAFEEMEVLGWLKSKKPRMVAVQSDGCAPIVRAFNDNKKSAEPWLNAKTIADGLKVPQAIGDYLILQTIRESKGTAVAVSDQEIMDAIGLMGTREGVFACPEGAASLAAFRKLREQFWIKDHEKVVLFNTGSGARYTHLWVRHD